MNEDRIEYIVICTSDYDSHGWLNASRVWADDFRDAARKRVERIQEAVPDVLDFLVLSPGTTPVFARRVRVTKVTTPTFHAEVI